MAGSHAPPIESPPANDRLKALAEAPTAHQIAFQQTAQTLEIQPGPHPLLSQLARKLKVEEGIRLVYDLDYQDSHPGSAAAFDRSTMTLYVPETLLRSGDLEDPTLKHELVHVEAAKTPLILVEEQGLSPK